MLDIDTKLKGLVFVEKEKRYTFEDLRKSEETRKKSIAEFYEQLNALETEIKEQKKIVSAATRAGNVDKVMEEQVKLSTLEQKKGIVLDVIETADKNRYYTDENVIDAANVEVEKRQKEIVDETNLYYKLADQLCATGKKLCKDYQEAQIVRNAVLNYHSIYRNPESVSDYYKEQAFRKQGLKELPKIPVMQNIEGLLRDRFPNNHEGEMIATVSRGNIVPGLTQEIYDKYHQ